MELQLLPSHKINKEKWNNCLQHSSAPLMYATVTYLDCMADNWEGIIAGDYSIVMPVPWRKKFGIKYCYDVPFVQQLGLFGKNVLKEDAEAFIKKMLQTFKYGDYSFNSANNFNTGTVRNNYTLSLASNYRSTSFFYAENLQADLSKARKNLLEYTTTNAEDVIALFRELYAARIPGVTQKNYNNFHKLCLIKEKENNLIARKVTLNKKLFAMNLLFKDRFRIYNLMSCTTPEGRSLFAGHFLHDCLIKEFSQTGLILDFEGSDIPGVAHFYKSFGAISQPYFKMHFNKLPPLLRLLKR